MKSKVLPPMLLLLIFSITYPTGAASVTLLDDYSMTGDILDVVHLGDQTITSFFRDPAQGISREFHFDFGVMGLPQPSPGGQFSVYVSQYGANPTRGYFDHIHLNGVDIGYLTVDSIVHWYDEGPFTGSNSLFISGDNTLTIYAGRSSQPGESPSNYDDFEFTNVFIDYDTAVPAPGAILLGTVGTGLAGWLRRRRTL